MPRREIYARLKAQDPEKVRADRRSSYQRHKAKEKAAHLAWARQPDVAERRKARQKELLASNSERALRKVAKDILARTMGVSQSLLPLDLVEAEMVRLKLGRLIRGEGE